MTKILDAPEWPEARHPLTHERAELARIDRYWAWLDSYPRENLATQPLLELPAHYIVSIDTAQDADYEAQHMRHSLGFNWGVYATKGAIFSIRDTAHRPVATLLVSNHEVIHARTLHNGMVCEKIYAIIQQAAARMGWSVLSPDQL